VTNLTLGQALTPALVVTHDKEFTPLYRRRACEIRSRQVAEDGDIRL